MISSKTVFVLGAGSSVEFGLPDGHGLIEQIARKTHFRFNNTNDQRPSGDQDILDQIKTKLRGQVDSYVRAGNKISSGIRTSRSVDDFLYNHGDDDYVVRLGKMAIVSSILESERNSHLYNSNDSSYMPPQTIDSLNDTWLYKLFQFMQTGVKKSGIANIFNNIEIINFNYDRCVEFLLFRLIEKSYSLSEVEIIPIMKSLKITHPYGTVGRLPWEEGDREAVKFGEKSSQVPLITLSNQIRTFTEQSHEESERDHWRKILADAVNVIFMGFGFHRQNVDLISAARQVPNHVNIYATAYKCSGQDQLVFYNHISGLIFGGGGKPPNIIGITCTDFIREYGLSLFS